MRAEPGEQFGRRLARRHYRGGIVNLSERWAEERRFF
jgi:hypothetical protein